MVEQEISDGPLSGIGVTVEIDKTKFGKRIFNISKIVDGVQILIVCPNNSQGVATLIPIIQHQGTEIMTDSWRLYLRLGNLGYQHFDVNHSQNSSTL